MDFLANTLSLYQQFFQASLLSYTALFRDIIRGNPDIKWESIKGLEHAKCLLKEAVVMPIKYPK